jgi:polyhydroxyalkanoate synthesis regulator phasin
MDEPENHTLRLLREIGAELQSFRTGSRQDMDDLKERIESSRRFAVGESVLGRYAAAEVDERLDALEKRISALEERR